MIETHILPLTGIEVMNRQRRRDEARYSPEHDDRDHANGDLLDAALCYLTPSERREVLEKSQTPVSWPWSRHDWNPSPEDRIKELGKAGALIAAEIDRLQRLAQARLREQLWEEAR